MAREVEYQLLREPEARVDGSAQVRHDIQAVWREVGSGDEWADVPEHHKDVLLPGALMITELATGTNPTKVNRYKNALVDYRNAQAEPLERPALSDWSEQGLLDYLDAYDEWKLEFDAQNAVAVEAADAADDFITDDLGLTYPVQFSL
jgi:hypothetical protein